MSFDGRTLAGRYRVIREIGRGGMGIVVLAEQTELRRRVALKILVDADEGARVRFRTEGIAAAAIEHPNVVGIIALHTADGEPPFIAMELVDGMSLARRLRERGPIPVPTAVAITIEILSALVVAHGKGIVHRDLKPSNILLVGDSPRIADFGIAKILGDDSGVRTKTGEFVGTPAYAAPEQLTGAPIDGRTDLHAVGVCLHEMITGARPWTETGPALIGQILHEPPPPLGDRAPPRVAAAIVRALAKKKEDRFATATEMIAALREPKEKVHPTRSAGLFFLPLLATAVIGGGIALVIALRRAPPPAVVVTPGVDAAEPIASVAEPDAEVEIVTAPTASAIHHDHTDHGCVCHEIRGGADTVICPRPLPPRCKCENGTASREGSFGLCVSEPLGQAPCPSTVFSGSTGDACRGFYPLVDGTWERETGELACSSCYAPIPTFPSRAGVECVGYDAQGQRRTGITICAK